MDSNQHRRVEAVKWVKKNLRKCVSLSVTHFDKTWVMLQHLNDLIKDKQGNTAVLYQKDKRSR